MHPSIDVETTRVELFGAFDCLLSHSLSCGAAGQFVIQVTELEWPQKLPINSPVFDDIAWINDLVLRE